VAGARSGPSIFKGAFPHPEVVVTRGRTVRHARAFFLLGHCANDQRSRARGVAPRPAQSRGKPFPKLEPRIHQVNRA
jgi:hypothetical protein